MCEACGFGSFQRTLLNLHCVPSSVYAVGLPQAFLWPFHTQAFCSQTWVLFGLVLLGSLFYTQNKPLACTPLPPRYGDLQRLSKYSFGSKTAPGKLGSQEGREHETCIGKSHVRRGLIQGMPSPVSDFALRTPHSRGSFQGTDDYTWGTTLGV